MTERIQLKEPGIQFDMLVSSVKPETVERNEYYLFANGTQDMLVPQSSVKGRFERMGITSVEQMIGKWVRFGRSTKISRANKPYWDIDWVSGAENGTAGGEMGKPNTGTPASAPSADSPAKPKMREAYKQLTEWVLKDVAPIYEENQMEFTGVVLAKCVDSLFREACNAGKVE